MSSTHDSPHVAVEPNALDSALSTAGVVLAVGMTLSMYAEIKAVRAARTTSGR